MKKSSGLILSLCLLSLIAWQPVQAESLYRASTTYAEQPPLSSRSLFSPPISRQVGDLVTIQISNTTQQDTSAELKITRTHVMSQNGSGLYNSMLSFFLNKLPFNTSRINQTLQAPTITGLNNANNLGSKAESTHSTTITDNITCQVTQVLPNGDLVVQGQKTILINKERSDLMVTGIVKPYYLDQYNQISSQRVGNFQMLQGGKGVISRQQNDSLANKVYQFLN